MLHDRTTKGLQRRSWQKDASEIIDIKQAEDNAKQSYLGGKVKPAENTSEVITIKDETGVEPESKADVKEKPKQIGKSETAPTIAAKEAISPILEELNRNEFSLSGMIKKKKLLKKMEVLNLN